MGFGRSDPLQKLEEMMSWLCEGLEAAGPLQKLPAPIHDGRERAQPFEGEIQEEVTKQKKVGWSFVVKRGIYRFTFLHVGRQCIS